MDENLVWLTQKTEETVLFPHTYTVNVIKLQSNKKVSGKPSISTSTLSPSPLFQGCPPFLAKILDPFPNYVKVLKISLTF